MPDKLIFIGNIRGPKGDTGTGLTIKEYYTTLDELNASVTNPAHGDAYGVGSSAPYDIYVYSERKGWVNNGALQPDINEQTPNYAEATTLESLTSGEKISLAFGKIKKAITELIAHKSDTSGHITSDERTAWNNKASNGHGLGVTAESLDNISFANAMQQGGGFYQVSTNEDTPLNTNEWLSLIQTTRNKEGNPPTGAQLAFYDFNSLRPTMWFRTMLSGSATPWVEMLHSGNIANHTSASPVDVLSYTGDGTTYGADNKNEITFTKKPNLVVLLDLTKSGEHQLIFPYGVPNVAVYSTDGDKNLHLSYSGNTMSWYSDSVALQRNEAHKYWVIGIGHKD